MLNRQRVKALWKQQRLHGCVAFSSLVSMGSDVLMNRCEFLNLWHSFVCYFCTRFKETVWYKRHLEWLDLQLHLCFWVFNSGSQPFTRRAGPPVCLGIAPRTTTFTGQNNKAILLLEVWVCGDLGNLSPQFGNLKDRNPVQNSPDKSLPTGSDMNLDPASLQFPDPLYSSVNVPTVC